MFKRVMVAVVGIPFLLLVLIWAPDWATMVLVAGMCAIGAHELMHAAAGERGMRLLPVTVVIGAAIPCGVFLEARQTLLGLPALPHIPATALFILLFLFGVFLCSVLLYGGERAIPFSGITAALFAGVAFPLMLSCLLRLRLLEHGAAWVFVPLCISFGSDTFALFAGMLCGKHKLAPHVSPKKTVEGGIGGLLGGVIGMTLFKLVVDSLHLVLTSEPPAVLAAGPQLSWMAVLLLGLAGSVISQIGDLSFSVIKREFGVKDYGKLLPGHGGILDRFDSVTFVAPFVWLVLSFLA